MPIRCSAFCDFFNNAICILAKKNLYTSLVRSQCSYCSIIWRAQLIKDNKFLENVQRRATQYILSNFSSDYRSRLISLNMLPLMMQFEFNDLIIFIQCIKYASDSFNNLDYVSLLWYFQICYSAEDHVSFSQNYIDTPKALLLLKAASFVELSASNRSQPNAQLYKKRHNCSVLASVFPKL